jgi:hypothetical protein
MIKREDLSFVHTGPSVAQSFDPETGEEFETGLLVTEAAHSDIIYGNAISCSPDVDKMTNVFITALRSLNEMAVVDKINDALTSTRGG